MARHWTLGTTAALASLMIGAAPAFADGGTSIAGATPVVIGQTEYGNTADGEVTPGTGCDYAGNDSVYDSWWSLPVTAGDHVTINWSGQPYGSVLDVYPSGTTDYNLFQVEPINDGGQATESNGDNTYSFAASVTGSMPLDFEDGYYCDAAAKTAPYNFTVSVLHTMVTTLIITGSNSRLHRSYFHVDVANTAGAFIGVKGFTAKVQYLYANQWKTAGSVSLPTDFYLPWSQAQRGRPQVVRVIVSGPGYMSATSRNARVEGV